MKLFMNKVVIFLVISFSLASCYTEQAKPINTSVNVTNATKEITTADFDKLSKYTVSVALNRSEAFAIGGDLKPEASLPLMLQALPKAVTQVVPVQKPPCTLLGLPIETDNRIETREWLVIQNKSCPIASPKGWRLFWVVQQSANGSPRILLTDKADEVKVLEWNASAKADSPTQRPLTISRSGRTCANCGSTNCQGTWLNKTGGYQRPSQFLVERTRYDSMSGLEQSMNVLDKCPLD